jgi:hypothetical protein
MRAGSTPVIGAEMRSVRRELAGADDTRVLQVLRYVDALADRGQADGLLAPLRDRLRRLRPSRPLRFARLLFTPLDPAIVSTRDWRAGAPQLPRSAIAPIVAMVRRARPDLLLPIEAIIKDSNQTEAARMRNGGSMLWTPSATLLRTAEAPPEWRDAGLPPAAFRALAAGCARCLGAAEQLDDMDDPGVPAADLDRVLAAQIAASEADGPIAWGMLLSVLLQRFPASDAPHRAAAAAGANRALRQSTEAAFEAAWAWIERAANDTSVGDPAEAAADLRRQAALLEVLARDPKQRRRALALQAELRAACAHRIESVAQERLVGPLQRITAADATDEGVLAVLETDARALRQLDAESRRLGTGVGHEAQLRTAAAAVTARIDMPPMDRARLVEILLGPQAALAWRDAKASSA